MPARIATALNAVGLYAIGALLVAAFVMQVALHELPCPLCMLQRALFCAVAAGLILNLRYGPRPQHYAMSMIAAFIGMEVSTRQILLHILPGDPGYGSAILSLHYYTWAFLAFSFAIVVVTVLLMFDRHPEHRDSPRGTGALAAFAVWSVIALAALNVLSTVLMCGVEACADDPVRYRLLDPIRVR